MPTWTIRHEEAVRRFLAPVRQALAAHPLDHVLGARIASLGKRLGIASFWLNAAGIPIHAAWKNACWRGTTSIWAGKRPRTTSPSS